LRPYSFWVGNRQPFHGAAEKGCVNVTAPVTQGVVIADKTSLVLLSITDKAVSGSLLDFNLAEPLSIGIPPYFTRF
jgi:hypothetical protein